MTSIQRLGDMYVNKIGMENLANFSKTVTIMTTNAFQLTVRKKHIYITLSFTNVITVAIIYLFLGANLTKYDILPLVDH